MIYFNDYIEFDQEAKYKERQGRGPRTELCDTPYLTSESLDVILL